MNHPRPLIPAATLLLLVSYAVTAAPGVTFWDSGELIAAVHSLGIPHPPGTPFYVLAAKVWTLITAPLDFAFRTNLFSAACAAAAVGILGVLVRRWTASSHVALCAMACAAFTSTLWLSATETEVYTAALAAGAVLLYIGDRAGTGGGAPWLALLAYGAGLAWTVHPTALLALPGAAVLAFSSAADSGGVARNKWWRLASRLTLCTLLGVSAVTFLVVRAAHDPAINQGNPTDFAALWDALTRAQYRPAGLWPRQAPLWLQLGNWFEYADWQFALGLDRLPPPSWRRTPVTAFFAAAAAYGFWIHRGLDRRSWRALGITFAVATVGVVLYLNLKAGPSYGFGVLPDGAPREARERDYFFLLGWVVWGLWAGVGVAQLASNLSRGRRAGLALAGIVALLPLAANWRTIAVERGLKGDDARTAAQAYIGPIADNALFLAAGDNDTYPLWYLQEVETTRRDVVVLTIPLLGARWYREELARRHGLLDAAEPRSWHGQRETLASACAAATRKRRPIVLTPLDAGRKLPDECVTR